MNSFEVNFDGLPGPTHNYCGLAGDNKASTDSQYLTSNPKAAALQGLGKMKLLHDKGLKQGILPPLERPHFPTLRKMGFQGTEEEIIRTIRKQCPELLEHLFSSSYMWVANSSTITPSIDSGDDRMHITPANKNSQFHRAMEVADTTKLLKRIFSDRLYFKHHDPLLSCGHLGDEGAANHIRFCREHGGSGVHLFVYGNNNNKMERIPTKYPPRQSLHASQSIARLHNIFKNLSVFAQQHPEALNAGAFHNDVISMGNQNFFVMHELAFLDSKKVLQELQEKVQEYCNTELMVMMVPESRISLKTAIKTYLFNSQIVTFPDETMAIIAPTECERERSTREYLEELQKHPDTPIRNIHYVNLEQSMKNGGGPGCLRIPVVMNQEELNATYPHVLFSDRLYERLVEWVNHHYRDRLSFEDFKDPKLIEETQTALDELTKILRFGSFYSFQEE